MTFASSRDASPNTCQLRFSRSSLMAPRRLECSRSSCHGRPGRPQGRCPSERATVLRATVLLGGVEPLVSDPRDELAAADVISSGGEDFSAFAVSRWPGLVRLAFGLTGDRWAAEDLAQATLARAYVAWRRVSRADDPARYLSPSPVTRAIAVSAGAG